MFPHIIWVLHLPSYFEQVWDLLVSLPVHLQFDVSQDIGLTRVRPSGPGYLHQPILLVSRHELLVDIIGHLYCVVGGLLQDVLNAVLGDVDEGGDPEARGQVRLHRLGD